VFFEVALRWVSLGFVRVGGALSWLWFSVFYGEC